MVGGVIAGVYVTGDNTDESARPAESSDVRQSAGLQCPAGDGVRSTSADSIGGSKGDAGAPVDIARAHLHGLQSADAVEQAESSHQSYPAVRVVRAGRVVAVMRLAPARHRTWIVTGLDVCGSAGVTLG